MKLGRYTSTPVKIPDPLRSIGGIFRFANETRDAIKSLYERKVIIPKEPSATLGHPWKVISNGDDTVTVFKGRAHHWTIGESTEGAALATPIRFDGEEELQVDNDGTSYIYAKLPIASAQVAGGTSNRQLTGTVTVENETDLPADIDTTTDVYLLLATVEKTDDVVTITEQHLKHDPVISIQDSEGEASHPWKATDNGNAFITIADGEVFELNSSSFFPIYWAPLSFSETSIECAGGDGDGYMLIDITTTDLVAGSTKAGDSAVLTVPSSIDVVFSFSQDGGADTSGNMVFPICEVNVSSAGIATVTKQLLTHNPHLSVTTVAAAP